MGPHDNGEYSTGTECDKTVFRNGFLRLHDAIAGVIDSGTLPDGDHPNVPTMMWLESLIKQEAGQCQAEPSSSTEKR